MTNTVFNSAFRDAMHHEFMRQVDWSDYIVMLDPMWFVRIYHPKGETLNAEQIREQAKDGALEHLAVVVSDVHGAGVTYSVTSENYSGTLETFEEAHQEALELYVQYSDEARDIQAQIVSDHMETLHWMLDAYVNDCLGMRIGEGLTEGQDDDDHKAEYQLIKRALDCLHWLALGNDLKEAIR